MLRRLTAALLFALAPSALAAPCAIPGLRAKVVHRSSPAAISAGGGFVVMVESSRDGTGPSPTELAIQPWWLRTSTGLVKPVIDVIAPGLAVYRIPDGARSVALENGKTQLAFGLIADKRLPPAAPKVTAIKRQDSHGRHPSTSVVVELAEAAPAGAVALVVADPKGKALAWGRPIGKSVWVYNSGGGCVSLPAGTVASSVGDQVTLFWLDEVGLVSPATMPVVVETP
ncbi:MAG: hypothetical protein H6Q90_3838 [Deltaproteobacteria bacterium]|nr:hypothetical protein [Deltaproteobacteria bacterium]